jgi:lipoic acid synthetase
VQRPGGEDYMRIRKSLRSSKLATVCEEARCPNIGECWSSKKGAATATIMVLGDTCTRGCRFCNVKTDRAPPLPAADEPEKTAEAIASWNVDYVVITSVDRDDIPDGGAEHFARVVRRVKQLRPEMRLECLTPDFNGTSGLEGVATVANAGLDVYAHNIETVERLQKSVRDRRAGYAESIAVLEHAKAANPKVATKSSIMLGLGEEAAEVRQTMRDLRDAGVDIFTLGQYLRPSKRHLKVRRMLPPAEYNAFKEDGLAMGFKYVASGPLVRSSYKAGEVFIEAFLNEREAASA